MKVAYSRRALRDLEEVLAYYLKVSNPGTAARFEARLSSVLNGVAKRPQNIPPVVAQPGVKVVLLVAFPYKVFVRLIEPDTLRVLHIRHTARRPV